MKKFLAIAAIAISLVACNDEKKTEETTVTTDTTTVLTPMTDTTVAPMMDTTMAPMADTATAPKM